MRQRQHIETQSLIEQAHLHFLRVVIEQLQVDRRMIGADPLPDSPGEIGLKLSEPLHQFGCHLTTAGHPRGMVGIKQLEMLAQRRIDLLAVG